MTDESGLDRRGALKTLLVLGAAAPLAWAEPLPARAAGLTSQQLAGQRVIFSYSGLTVPSALLQQISAGPGRRRDLLQAGTSPARPRSPR